MNCTGEQPGHDSGQDVFRSDALIADCIRVHVRVSHKHDILLSFAYENFSMVPNLMQVSTHRLEELAVLSCFRGSCKELLFHGI